MILKNSRNILGFDDRVLMAIGMILVSLGMNLILFGPIIKDNISILFTSCFLIAFLYTLFYWLIFRTLYMYITRRFPGYENIKKRYTVLISLSILCFIPIKIILQFFIERVFNQNLLEEFRPEPILEIIGSFIFLSLVISIYEGVYLFSELKKSRIKQQMLMKENISSQLEGLKNQVNPHFLFNSLNTLASIIPDDPERGVRFVTKLSKVYRYILDIKDQKLISVKEELDYLSSYTYLLKERFGDNIHISIEVPDADQEQLIIPLSLQITIENAIKHNIITRSKPLYISVFLENNNLVVKNNLQKKSTVGTSTKMGLLNIKNRYKFFTDKEVGVIATVKHFIVTLPLLSSINKTT